MAVYNLRNRPVSTIVYKLQTDKKAKKQIIDLKNKVNNLECMYIRIEKMLLFILILLLCIILKEIYDFISEFVNVPDLFMKLYWSVYTKCNFDFEKSHLYLCDKYNTMYAKIDSLYTSFKSQLMKNTS